MNIIQNSEENYGDVKFTLTEEDKKKIVDSITDHMYNSNGHKDTMLKEDVKILYWIVKSPNEFTSETIIYCKTTLDRVQYWLQ